MEVMENIGHTIEAFKDEMDSISRMSLTDKGAYTRAEEYEYSKFYFDRAARAREVQGKASNVQPHVIHKPLTDALKQTNVTVSTAVDIYGGSGKHTEWLFNDLNCNVIYTDVEELVEKLPEKFPELQTVTMPGGIKFMYDDKAEKPHWICAVPTLLQDGGKIQATLDVMQKAGLAATNKADLVLSNDILNFYKTGKPRAEHAATVHELLAPGGISDESGRCSTKFGEPVNLLQLMLQHQGYGVLYLGEEAAVSERAKGTMKKHAQC